MLWHVEGKKCCINCFAHKWLRDYVSEATSEIGPCHYCGKRRSKLIEVAQLAGPFENLMTMYARSEFGGEFLIDLIQDNWKIFDESFFDQGGASKLLEDILLASWDDDSGEPLPDATESYERQRGLNLVENWEKFL